MLIPISDQAYRQDPSDLSQNIMVGHWHMQSTRRDVFPESKIRAMILHPGFLLPTDLRRSFSRELEVSDIRMLLRHIKRAMKKYYQREATIYPTERG